MPQTKEHLAILDLLQIPGGLIVLTKTDLASDLAWLDLLETDIRRAVSDTMLKDAPIIRVSAKNKTGLSELLAALETILKDKLPRPDLNRPRLPIDRVFTMSGFGTIVTGTLSDGQLSVGDEVEILPGALRGRVRGLQTHKKREEQAVPGSRTAVNISGIDTELIQRGDVVVHPNQYVATRRVDAHFRLLKDASYLIKHNDEVKFFVGASETIAVLRLLGTEELKPGEEAWIQLELRDPIVAVRGDRYILRRPSPSETLGGGEIIDHQPKGRHKRFDDTVIKSFESLAQGSPADVLLEAALSVNIAPLREIVLRSRLEPVSAGEGLKELLENGKLVLLEEGEPTTSSDILATSVTHWNTLLQKTTQLVEGYHRQFPLRRGIPREELKSKLQLAPRVFNAVLSLALRGSMVKEITNFVALPGHEVKFNAGDQAKVTELMRKFEKNPFGPPSVKECQGEVGDEIFNALIELNELVTVSADVVFRRQDYETMQRKIRTSIEENGQITLGEVRDMLNTTRKYVQALLEHLDAVNITMRNGDARVLKK